jgi:Carboxypeptidase regulatory-like domain/TonB-dependent Receptor Plug Domain
MKQFFCLLLIVAFLVPSYLVSQSTSATISGGITDPAGNFIVGASVDIANDETGVLYSVRTNSSGMYFVPILPPGHYHVQVSKQGFKTIIKSDVVLNVQSAIALNFVLPIGATSESVTVEAGSSLLNTTDASVSTVVDRKFVQNMPLNGRSFQDLISMTPGVVTQSPQTTNQTVGFNGDFSVNGQRTESNYYTVDGVSGNILAGNGNGGPQAAVSGALGGATALGTTQSLVSVDALQEFRVVSSTYSAEYGRTPGGQFSLVTRSGTNIFHGSAFDYLRNNFFDANDWFNNHYGTPISALRQNDFGGTFGGPLRIPHLYNGKNKSFLFGSYEGLRLTQPQAASIQYVPDTNLRKSAALELQPILNAFPLPSSNGVDYGTLAQFIAPYSLPGKIDSTSVRWDQTFASKHSLFFRYGYTPSFTSSRSLSQLLKTHIDTQTYTFGVTSQPSRSITNELRIGYARGDSTHQSSLDSFGGASPINLAQTMGAGGYPNAEPIFELIFPGVGTSALETTNASNRSRQWNVVDALSWSLGHHQIKFGADYRRFRAPTAPVTPIVEGLFETSQSLENNSANLLILENTLSSEPILNETAFFAQDEWRATPRLNLSMGLRWEIDPPPTGGDGRDAYTVQGSTSNPSTLALAPLGTPLWKTSWYNFAPRLGVAWTAHNQPGRETIVRAGLGVFFDTGNQEAIKGFQGVGFLAYNILTNQPLPATASQLDFTPNANPPYTSASVYAFPPHFQLPYTLEWNVSLQQALGRAQALTFSYVASNGRRLIQEQQLSLSSLNSNFGTVYYYPNGVTSNYQALQVQFQRSINRGVHALGSYTWSHSLDYGSNNAALPLMRGNSDFDVRNNFQGGLSWDLPDASKNKMAGAFLNDWGVDGRLNAREGFPITLNGNLLTDPTNGSQYYSGVNYYPLRSIYLYGSQYPGGRVLNGGANNEINPAFTAPAGTTSGNAPRNFVRGFGATQINLAARKEFPLTEGFRLQFRAETFNLLNHPNFGYVDPTLSDATFGQATKMLNQSLGTVSSLYQQGGPRSMQFALKLVF